MTGYRQWWRRCVGAAAAWVDCHDWLFLPLPAAIFVVLMLGFPLYYTLSLSLHSWFLSSLTPPMFVGLENYRQMFFDTRLWLALVRTLYFVALAVGAQIVLGVVAALLFHRPFVGRGFARTLFMLPMFATPAAMAMVWAMLFNPIVGPLSYYLGLLGVQILWVADPYWVIPSLVLVDTWHWTPLIMLIVLAGLAALPTEPYEAARIDGASSLQIFWYLTLPLLRPTIIVAAMFRTIDALKTFDIIMVITRGGPSYASETLNIYAFEQLFVGFHFGYGSALLVLLGVVVYTAAIIFSKIRRSVWYA